MSEVKVYDGIDIVNQADEADKAGFDFEASFVLVQDYDALKSQNERLILGLEAISDYISLHRLRQKDWDVQYIHAIQTKLADLGIKGGENG